MTHEPMLTLSKASGGRLTRFSQSCLSHSPGSIIAAAGPVSSTMCSPVCR